MKNCLEKFKYFWKVSIFSVLISFRLKLQYLISMKMCLNCCCIHHFRMHSKVGNTDWKLKIIIIFSMLTWMGPGYFLALICRFHHDDEYVEIFWQKESGLALFHYFLGPILKLFEFRKCRMYFLDDTNLQCML